MKGKAMVKPGVDKLRYEHLKAMIGRNSEPSPQEEEFCTLFAELLTLIIRGEYPVDIKCMLRDNELIALDKGNDDIRPIGMGETIRKVVSSVAFKRTAAFNSTHLRHQYGLKRNGAEHIIHSIRFLMEEHPTWDLYCVDADNAFNRANRVRGLKEVCIHQPELLPLMKDMYDCISNGWYNGLSQGASSIPSKNGYHQGDVLASWMYVMTMHPLINRVDEIIAAEFPNEAYYQGWYIDDGNILAPRPVMKRIIQVLQEEGPSFGYIIKKNKGSYLLGKCASRVVALLTKAELVNSMGLSQDIIHVSPLDELVQSVAVCGAKVLGSPVGSIPYILSFCNDYLQDLRQVAADLINFPDVQSRFLLFINCFLPKVNFLFRTLPTEFLSDFVTQFEELTVEILASILGCASNEISEENFGQMCFGISCGGLGMHFAIIAMEEIHIASNCAFD